MSVPFPETVQHLIQNDRSLAELTWLGIGGPSRYFAEPSTSEQLAELVRAAHQHSIPIRIIGSGSNLLVRESGFDGLVISLSSAAFGTITVDGRHLRAGAGAKLGQVITSAVGAGLGGLENLAGVPGTVGGAVTGNAEAGGGDIGSQVENVQILASDGTFRRLERGDLQFSHRKSNLAGLLVTEVEFLLEPTDVVALTKRLQKLWIVAQNQRPVDEPRVAQPFIDPDGFSVADLIQATGLSGVRLGNASLATSNSRYVLAHSGATSDDVTQLLQRIQNQVSQQAGIDLQLNLQIW